MSRPEDAVAEPQPKTKRVPYPVFNDRLSTNQENQTNKAATFHPFQRLSPELRLSIWTIVATPSRFLRLRLDGQKTADVDVRKLYKENNELGNIVSGYKYCVQAPTMEEWQPSTLSSVCHEARAVFRRIYRVRFPTRTSHGNHGGMYMHISPEHNILYISHGQSETQYDAIIPCLHDLVAYDPKGIGITKLALGYNLKRFLRADPKQLQAAARRSIAKLLLTSLQEVYVHVRLYESSRAMCGGIQYQTHIVHLNRSIPLQPESQFYTDMGYDSRPIQADLPYFGSRPDPRYSMYCWNQFKANFGGGERQIPTKYLVGVSTSESGERPEIATRQDLVDRLQSIDNGWEEWCPGLSSPLWGNIRTKEEFEREHAILLQVVGMWELPAEAFGDVPQTPDEKYNDGWHAWKPRSIRDLSSFHPKLWCFNLA